MNADKGTVTIRDDQNGAFSVKFSNIFTGLYFTVPLNAAGQPDTLNKLHLKVTDTAGNKALLYFNNDLTIGADVSQAIVRSAPLLTPGEVTLTNILRWNHRRQVMDIKVPSMLFTRSQRP